MKVGEWLRGGAPREVKVDVDAADLPDRIVRADQALSHELATNTSVNVRGLTLAGFASLALLVLALFSGTWLDDSRWEFSDVVDFLLQLLQWVSLVGLLLCVLVALVALLARRPWRSESKDRIDAQAAGNQALELELVMQMIEKQRKATNRKSTLTRVAQVCLGIGIFGAAVQAALFAADAKPVSVRGEDLVEAVQDAIPGVALPPVAEQARLATDYAPTVFLHSSERTGPMHPDDFIKTSSLEFGERRGQETVAARGGVVRERLGALCPSFADGCYSSSGFRSSQLTRPYDERADRARALPRKRGFFLDIDDDRRVGDTGRDPRVPMFYEFRGRRAQGEILITYWLFYGFSSPFIGPGADRDNLSPFRHEGDWENVDVALREDSLRPVALIFYGHGKPHRIPWAKACKITADGETCSSAAAGHPIVFSALASHASYPTEATKRGPETAVCREKPVRACSHDFRDRGVRWQVWDDPGGLRSARDQPWYGFGGAWGRRGAQPDTTGPLGPSRFKLPRDPEPGELVSRR